MQLQPWASELLLVGLVVLLGALYVGSVEGGWKRKFLALEFIGPAAGIMIAVLVAIYTVILILQGRFFAVFLAVIVLVVLFGFVARSWHDAKQNYHWIRTERKERIDKLVKNLLFYWPKGAISWARQQWRKRAGLKKALGKKKV